MDLSNWAEIAVGIAILTVGILLLIYFRRKFRRLNGFEGIVTERGKLVRRTDPDWKEELDRLEALAKQIK